MNRKIKIDMHFYLLKKNKFNSFFFWFLIFCFIHFYMGTFCVCVGGGGWGWGLGLGVSKIASCRKEKKLQTCLQVNRLPYMPSILRQFFYLIIGGGADFRPKEFRILFLLYLLK